MRRFLMAAALGLGGGSACGQVLTSVADLGPAVQTRAIADMGEQIDNLPTPNSVLGVNRVRYSNDLFEVRAIDEPVPNDSVYGLLSRNPGNDLISNVARFPFPPFAQPGIEIIFSKPVEAFGFFSLTGTRSTPREVLFYDESGDLIDSITYTSTTNGRQEVFVGLRSVGRLIARIELVDTREDFASSPSAIAGPDFYLVIPSPGAAGLAMVGLVAVRRRR